MQVEENIRADVDAMDDLGRRASQILVTHDTRARYPSYLEALQADPILPELPETKTAATPHVLLLGPFQDEPDLVGIALYVGIGLIRINEALDGVHYAYTFSPLDGEGMETRLAYLSAAFQLYFDDVTVLENRA